jgi:thiamine-monophosphate kinase
MSGSSNRHFGPGREFSLIESLFDAGHFSREGKGLGDDGYLLKLGGETWAVSTDSSVEGIHYRLDWTSPEAALEKAVLSNLSDVNAMGGRTALVFLNLGALQSWNEAVIRRLGETLRKMEAEHGFKVAGGDTVIKEKESFFTVTVMGPVTGKPLLRSGARPGQRVYVSGTLGRSAAGLHLLRSGLRAMDGAGAAFIAAHARPEPPLELGPCLAGLRGMTGSASASASAESAAFAAIDISDGLSSELWHLSRQSGCRLRVEWGKLPYEGALAAVAEAAATDGKPADWRSWVLDGGEEYQLLFTGDFSAGELGELRRRARITEIGSVSEGQGVGILDEAGEEKELKAGGWSH